MAQFKKKGRRAHSIATSKADTLTKELPFHAMLTSSAPIPNLPSHLSVANMRLSLEDVRTQQNGPPLKRAFSEPCFHSWDFGFFNDVFEAEYDISPASTERYAWDEKEGIPSRPGTPSSGDEDLLLGEKKGQQDIIFKINDAGYVISRVRVQILHQY